MITLYRVRAHDLGKNEQVTYVPFGVRVKFITIDTKTSHQNNFCPVRGRPLLVANAKASQNENSFVCQHLNTRKPGLVEDTTGCITNLTN